MAKQIVLSLFYNSESLKCVNILIDYCIFFTIEYSLNKILWIQKLTFD